MSGCFTDRLAPMPKISAPLSHRFLSTHRFLVRCPDVPAHSSWFGVQGVKSTPNGLVISGFYGIDEAGNLLPSIFEKFKDAHSLEVVVREARTCIPEHNARAFVFAFRFSAPPIQLPLNLNVYDDGHVADRILFNTDELVSRRAIDWPE